LLDALLHGAFTNEFVHKHGLILSNAVGAVRGLVFNGGIPPRVIMNDGVGIGEGEASAACLERDEKYLGLASLKPLNQIKVSSSSLR
jgi:hypothetical protein